MKSNPYKPFIATVADIRGETTGQRPIKTFMVRIDDTEARNNFQYKSGQTAMLSVFGVGECMISISSSPTRKDYLEFSIMQQGLVTSAFHRLAINDTVGIRGPYGNNFPLEQWQGKNLLFIGGGIGQAPLRSVYLHALDKRSDYGNITIIYGTKSYEELAYKEELFALEKQTDVQTYLSIDWKTTEQEIIDEEALPGWTKINAQDPAKTSYQDTTARFTGYVPQIVQAVKPKSDNTVALTCGPPIMIKFVIQALKLLGFPDDHIYTTLEMRMKCGIGKCGRCNIGNIYVCQDGPVFTYEQLKQLPGEY